MILSLALILDAILGEPRWLWSRVPHPAVLIGRAIGWADGRFNHGSARRLRGVLLCASLILGGLLVGTILQAFGPLVEALAAAILLAQKSLAQHVAQVADALRVSTGSARIAVARIVGRDTAALDDAGIARAAIESGAENLSDGVIAPAFWFLIGGLPAMLAYKAVNTADSMVGYRTPRHQDFGWASARMDDLLNLVPARLTAVLISLGSGRWPAWGQLAQDARLHRSPNAGWPEAAMAQSLNVALAGPRTYHGTTQDFPWVHADGARSIGPDQVDRAVTLQWRAWALMLVLALVFAPILH